MAWKRTSLFFLFFWRVPPFLDDTTSALVGVVRQCCMPNVEAEGTWRKIVILGIWLWAHILN